MLSDILATIIAFISIILLLSIVVTAMVQVSQAFLRLRSRNLMKGLAALLVDTRMGKGPKAVVPTRAARASAKKDATKLMNASNVALTDRVNNPEWWVRYWLTGPKVSWIKPDELTKAVEETQTDLGKGDATQLTADFKKSETHLRKRFLRLTRGWSVMWALIVAVAFQVSAPTLFSELSRDAERRERIVADADQILAYGAESLSRSGLDMAAPEALEILATQNEHLRETIEQASGVGTTREFIIDELELALEGLPDRDRLVADYSQLLDEVAERKMEETRQTVEGAMEQLAQYDIELWPRGLEYYIEGSGNPRWDAIIGVIITAILLSFGGSFWFEQLRNVLALRDSMAGGAVTTGKKDDKGTEHRLVIDVAKHEDTTKEPSDDSSNSENTEPQSDDPSDA